MKKAKIFICMILISMFMLSFSLPAFASSAQPTLEDYQNVARDIIQKYDMEEQMQYKLLAIPHDKNLEQYSIYIEEMASMTAKQFSEHPERFDGSANSVSTEPDNMIHTTPNDLIQPRVMYIDKQRSASKTYSGWFSVSANYIVTYNLDYPSNKWISQVVDVYGGTSYLGNLQGYIFSELGGSGNKGWTFNAGSSMISCWIRGTYRVVYNNITEERGQITLRGDFKAN